jgi:uncharacterized membrane protein
MMSLKDVPSPSERPCVGSSAAFDAVLTPHNAPRFRKIAAIVGALAIPILTRTQTQLLGDGVFVFAPSAISIAACIFALRLWCESRRACERIVVGNGVIRVSRYVHGKLIEQRRIRSSGLAVEFKLDSEGKGLVIALREKPRRPMSRRTIEIARDLTPQERAKFLEQFIEGLRHSEANHEIFPTVAPSEISGAPSTRIPRNFGRAQGVRTHSRARRSSFRD